MKIATGIGVVLGVSLCLLACNDNKSSGGAGKTEETTSKPATATQPTAAKKAAPTVVDAKEVFSLRCAPCHGDSGKGDGPGAAAITPKPRDYTDVAWQDSVTDEELKKTILYGGAAVGKSPAMPASTDLDGKPELDALVTYIRSFKGK